MRKLRAGFKLWLDGTDLESGFGDGRWRLLEEIAAKGSLNAACKALGISYRKAWGDLEKAQEALNVTLVEKHRGGPTGGQSVLTESGRRWIKAYARFRRDVEKGVEKAYKKHIEELVK